MPLYKLLDQELTPVYTGISSLVTIAVEAVIFLAVRSLPGAGFGAIGIYYSTALLIFVGVILNVFLGSLAHRRGEYWGGRIAASGIAVWLLTISGLIAVPRYRAEQEERSRTWGADGAIGDVLIQHDGKIVLLGAGIVRLLPDGDKDPSFRRDYSFSRRGSLPGPLRNYWPDDGTCAAALPNGDLLLAAGTLLTVDQMPSGGGWIGRILPDGRDGLEISPVTVSTLRCWGLAVQPDGSVLSGWDGQGGGFWRNLPDGRRDPTFHPTVSPWLQSGAITVQETGKILLAGWVQQRYRMLLLTTPTNAAMCVTTVARLNPDGTSDDAFNSVQQCQSAAPGPIAFATLPNGSMLVASNVYREGVITTAITHVDPNGVEVRRSPLRDALRRFVIVSAIVPVQDGRILVGGQIVERLLDDGTHDATFQAHRFSFVRKILLQGDKILVLDGNRHLHRLKSDGSIDPTFRLPVLRVYSR